MSVSSVSSSAVLPGRTAPFIGLLVVATMMLGGLLRWPALDASLWIDEAGSLHQAAAADFWAGARHDVHPPLYYLLLRGELQFTSSIPLLRLSSLASGVLLAGLAAWALRASLAGALVAGLMGAALPELIHHSQQLRPYALLHLLLGIALALAARLAFVRQDGAARFLLAAVLVLAAATHLVTVFFLVALVPLLAWPVRTRGAGAILRAVWPLLPAGAALLWFKFFFVTQPNQLPEGWWLPATDARAVFTAFREAAGWEEIHWLSDACLRRLSFPAWLVPLTALAAAGMALASVWAARRNAIGRLLFATALLYWGALVAYSLCFEPIVLVRTVSPGLLPFGAAVAWNIGQDPVRRRRWAAVVAVALYLAMLVVPVWRKMQVPAAGLHGMTLALRADYQPGDLVIFFREMKRGFDPYWPQLDATRPLVFDTTRPLGPQLAALRERLAGLPPPARVWVAHLDDYYFRQNQAMYAAVGAEIARYRQPPAPYRQEDDLTLERADPPVHP